LTHKRPHRSHSPRRRSLRREPGARARPMTGADVAGVLELRRRVHWSAGPEAFEILLKGFLSARWAVAEAPSGSLVGMVGAVPLGEVGILCHLAVHPAHRGRGLGTQLSRWAITYLRSQGARVVRLESTPVAEKLYESLGFRRVGRRVLYHREVRSGVRPGIDGEYKVAPLKASDLPEVYGLDRRSFGGDRSARIEALLRRQGGSGPAMRRDGWRDTSSAAESAWVPGWPLPRRPGGR
jgi:ribosomal protein S18 acetylase RimI-like enzyme